MWQKTDEKSRVHKGGSGRTGVRGEQARWSRSDRLSGGFRGCQGVGKDRKADKQVLANTLGVLPRQEQY